MGYPSEDWKDLSMMTWCVWMDGMCVCAFALFYFFERGFTVKFFFFLFLVVVDNLLDFFFFSTLEGQTLGTVQYGLRIFFPFPLKFNQSKQQTWSIVLYYTQNSSTVQYEYDPRRKTTQKRLAYISSTVLSAKRRLGRDDLDL